MGHTGILLNIRMLHLGQNTPNSEAILQESLPPIIDTKPLVENVVSNTKALLYGTFIIKGSGCLLGEVFTTPKGFRGYRLAEAIWATLKTNPPGTAGQLPQEAYVHPYHGP